MLVSLTLWILLLYCTSLQIIALYYQYLFEMNHCFNLHACLTDTESNYCNVLRYKSLLYIISICSKLTIISISMLASLTLWIWLILLFLNSKLNDHISFHKCMIRFYEIDNNFKVWLHFDLANVLYSRMISVVYNYPRGLTFSARYDHRWPLIFHRRAVQVHRNWPIIPCYMYGSMGLFHLFSTQCLTFSVWHDLVFVSDYSRLSHIKFYTMKSFQSQKYAIWVFVVGTRKL